METASGSLVITPKPKENAPTPKPVVAPSPAPSAAAVAKKHPEGPQAVLLRSKTGEPLEVRTAKSVKVEADFCEIIDQDGKLSLVGKALVVAILPLPKDGSSPTREEAEAALRLYAEKTTQLTEAGPLLAEAKASWEKWAVAPAATTASAPLPQLEDVETAAGVEKPLAETGYPGWFRWGALSLILALAFLAYLWSRPRSYLT
jgi:hypothetical protein